MPGRFWYWIAAAIFVGGAVGAAMFFLPRLAELQNRLTRIVVPGTAVLSLATPGRYTIFHESESVVDGRLYRANSVSGLGVTLISAADGRAVPLAPPQATTSYAIGGRSGTAILTFEIDRPGGYRLAAAYGDGRPGPRTVLTVGEGVVGGIFGAILGTLAIALGTAGIAIAIAATVFLKRRRLLRAMPTGGPGT